MLATFSKVTYSHDTTHIHPLITAKIAELIESSDIDSKAYVDLYILDPNPLPNVDPNIQLLYWGTDFDPVNLSAITDDELKKAYLVNNDLSDYRRNNNVMDGVVYEDDFDLLPVPEPKVRHHFYHAQTGIPLTVLGTSLGDNSANRAMLFFNQSIESMGGYKETSIQEAFFLFGQALHHVEDMIAPAHIHNDAENSLSASMLRYGQLKNTHVENTTLRFLNSPRLALKQTEPFQNTKSRVMI